MAGEFDDRHLHAETNAEKRDAILARVADGGNLAFAAAVAEAAGNENAVSLLEQRLRIFLLDFLRFDAIEVDLNLVGDSAMNQSFHQAFVRFFEAHVFADDGDAHRSPWGFFNV